MKHARNAEGIEYLVEPYTPQEQLAVLATSGAAVTVAISADLVRDSDAFYEAVDAAVLGKWFYLQINGYDRVGWLDKDTVLYELSCFVDEDDVYDYNDGADLPPRGEA